MTIHKINKKKSIDEEDENNLDVDPTKRDVSSSTNDEQDAGALLLVLAVTGVLSSHWTRSLQSQ